MIHTSVPGTCATCEYYWNTRKACRRNPPQVVVSDRLEGVWPPVDPAHWCGEYEESYDVQKRDTTGAV